MSFGNSRSVQLIFLAILVVGMAGLFWTQWIPFRIFFVVVIAFALLCLFFHFFIGVIGFLLEPILNWLDPESQRWEQPRSKAPENERPTE